MYVQKNFCYLKTLGQLTLLRVTVGLGRRNGQTDYSIGWGISTSCVDPFKTHFFPAKLARCCSLVLRIHVPQQESAETSSTATYCAVLGVSFMHQITHKTAYSSQQRSLCFQYLNIEASGMQQFKLKLSASIVLHCALFFI